MKRYTVELIGRYEPLYETDCLVRAQYVQMKWQDKLGNLNVVLAVDSQTGEIVAMRDYVIDSCFVA